MREQQFSILVMVILMLPTFGAFAQEDSTKKEEVVVESRSQLRLGLAGYSRRYSNLGVTIEYERFISPHWSVELNLFGNLKTNDDYRIRSGFQVPNQFEFTDYQDELHGGLAFNYYLKKGSRSGHYFSLSANYLFGFYSRKKYTVDLQTAAVTENGKRLFGSNPVIGISYGYRKNLKSGFFVEGRAGTLYRGSINNILRPLQSLEFEGQITLGWVIPTRKKR